MTTINKIRIFQPKSTKLAANEGAAISDFEIVASYNWLDQSDPTILVPGIPPIWSPPVINPTLRADTGPRYVDQNADRNPWSPTEPLIRAVQTLQPNFDFAAVNIVSDRRPLRKLYGFVKGELDDFKFSVEIVGTTAVFSRMDQRTREEIPEGKFCGFRNSFEEAYTKLAASAKGSTSHHRIACYSFDGLKFLVRFAVDAYVKSNIPEHDKSKCNVDSDLDDVIENVKAISLGKARTMEDRPLVGGVKVIEGGHHVPQEATLELTTRSTSARWSSLIEDKMADLWLSQTPTLVLAHHESAPLRPWHHLRRPREQPTTEFNEININDMTDRLAAWERANAETLQKFSTILRDVAHAVQTINQPCIVSYEGPFSIQVVGVEHDKLPQVPDDLRVLFATPKAVEEEDMSKRTNAESGGGSHGGSSARED